jgi:hypothetical protein
MGRLDFGVAWEEDIVGPDGLGHQASDEEESNAGHQPEQGIGKAQRVGVGAEFHGGVLS